MIRSLVAVVVSAGALLSVAASADSPEDSAEPETWKTSAELGAVVTRGNTEGTTVQGKLDAKQRLENWDNQYIFRVLFKEDVVTRGQDQDREQEKERTAERYYASVKSAYGLEREHDNLFVYVSHTEDHFGAYRRYTTLSAGYGTRLLDAERAQLAVEIGPGYYRGEQVLADDLRETEQGAMVRAAAVFDWQVSESADFQQTLSIESGQDNTRSIAETSLSTRVSDALQMKVGVQVASDSDVAPGKKNTDTTSYVNLVYNF